MEYFEPKEIDFNRVIKDMLSSFIEKTNVIPVETKRVLMEDLGSNFYDERFDPSVFFDDAIGFSVMKWEKQNMDLADLWKSIAIENAKINNDPHEVASKVVNQFNLEFNVKKETRW